MFNHFYWSADKLFKKFKYILGNSPILLNLWIK